jgi:predicted ATPase
VAKNSVLPGAKLPQRVSGNLRFTGCYLENWKNFRKADVPLERRTFVVGPNASGKSNFLDAFRFLGDISRSGGGFQAAVHRRTSVSAIRNLSARRYPEIALRVLIGTSESPEAWTYELRFTQNNNRIPQISLERVTRFGTEILKRPLAEDKADPERLTQTYLEQVTTNKNFREITDFLSSVRYLHVVPQLIREPERSVGRRNDPYGGDFLDQLARTPKRTLESRLERIRRALQIAVPQLAQLELERDELGNPHLKGRYAHWRPNGGWQSEDQFSDGTLRLIGLLWSILDGNGPLLLEEPELSLNAGVVRRIPEILYRMQRKNDRQVILSTHAGDMFIDSGVGAHEVLVVTPSSDGSQVRVSASIPEVQHVLAANESLAEAIMPLTIPPNVFELPLFADLEP